ncbi:helix-turn-helix domain-containing protein [Brevibacillus brevis]|uniref:helix-turn-helix domain-containing protein n=1 Tax=Brevibacillus brevis TaxID=1393 RepID=UPI00165DD52E|nr:helix-turn-helix transcriptional regulator [Brevibacillus brevis]
MNKLGDLLVRLRGKETLRDASKRIGISHTYLSLLEKGIDPRTGKTIRPTADTLKLIAKAYQYDYEQLLKVAGILSSDQSEDTLPPGVPDYYKAFLEVIDDPNVSDASKELARLLLKTPLQPEQLDLLRGMIANFKAANK